MEYRFFLFLYCLNKFNGERSSSAIYHLLTGKKSSQTIQDAKLFQLDFLFQTMKYLKKEELEHAISLLRNKNFIHLNDEERYRLTALGKTQLKNYNFTFPDYLNGWEFGDQSRLFWMRYALLVQTVSNLKIQKNNFYPVITDQKILSWTKNFIKKNRLNRNELAMNLYEETYLVLDRLPELSANIFLFRLSSHERTGWTNDQIARYFQMDPDYIYMLFQSALHAFIYFISTEPANFNLLNKIIGGEIRTSPITKSTRHTQELLEQQLSIDEISRIRRLKQNTIEDHIVELALYKENFDINQFVPLSLQQKVLKVSEKLKTKRLKQIKETLQDEASYFQIRLVLAKGDA